MVDEFSARYGDLLTGSYDCVDRMVRHEALCVRVEVRDLHRQAVAAV